MKKEYKDVVIIGAGVAGLRAAIALEKYASIAILAKDELEESASEYAQGGIAVALSDEDTIGIHFQDTIKAGDGLCNEQAVQILVQEGPERILELIEWGTKFDKDGTKLAFTREAAHSRNRILHAHGDSTGKEVVRALVARAKHIPNFTFMPKHFTLKLLLSDENHVKGVICIDEETKSIKVIYTRAVLLATGGIGRVYLKTTNPPFATGDGIAYAYEAGADLTDMEFVQFHPTMLSIENAPPFLLSEALRGEGAYLINVNGERFMHKYHPLKELAPRDIVSRAIIDEMKATKSQQIFLDLRHLDPKFIKKRFPMIYNSCLAYDIDITTQLVPVYPAAHYFMGGVKTDLECRTSLTGLYAAGEVACNGVHGANRLASNSLLEGIVYGARAGLAIKHDLDFLPLIDSIPLLKISLSPIKTKSLLNIQNEIKKIAWDKIGIKRCAKSLSKALSLLSNLANQLPKEDFADRTYTETKNMLTVAMLIAHFAYLRTESRGAHYRTDFPQKNNANWLFHQTFNKHTISFAK
jgi:L-aspartate oxidase